MTNTTHSESKPTNQAELGEEMELHRTRLKRLVELRLDQRVRGRVDASDVLQETQLEAFQRSGEYFSDPKVPVFIWLRYLTLQKVSQIHRQHLGTQARDATREISIFADPAPAATSAVLAAQLVGHLTTASHAAVRAEMKLKVEQALNSMDDRDRELLSLLHFEQLTQREAAAVIGISEKALGGRYVRALAKLKRQLV
ncbi:MAG: sigma-70 family RNA polymerase sigma factor [Pirellulaceae bacterium]